MQITNLLIYTGDIPVYKEAVNISFDSTLIPDNHIVWDKSGIEAYSQRASIEFMQSLQGEDVYVDVLGYKSYAQLFYARKPMHKNPLHSNKSFLLHGDIDKDVYFVTRIDRLDGLGLPSDVKEVGRKNGFVFLKREKK